MDPGITVELSKTPIGLENVETPAAFVEKFG